MNDLPSWAPATQPSSGQWATPNRPSNPASGDLASWAAQYLPGAGGTIIGASAAADPAHVAKSGHLFVMSDGARLAVYLDGSNLGYRLKPAGGAWSSFNVMDQAVVQQRIGLGGGVYARSYGVRTSHNGGDNIIVFCSVDTDDGAHYGDLWRFWYAAGAVQIGTFEETDNNTHICGGLDWTNQTAYVDGSGNARGLAAIRVSLTHVLAQMDNYAMGPNAGFLNAFGGLSFITTNLHWEDGPRCGIVVNKNGVDMLAYGCLPTGTAFFTEYGKINGNAPPSIPETPPAPAANPAGITARWDGAQFVFIINENNAKLRFLTRNAPTSGTTSGALSTGAAITAIPVNALPQAIPAGQVYIWAEGATGTASHSQAFATAGALAGAVSIPVSSQVPNFAYAAGATVIAAGTYGAWTDILTDAGLAGEPAVCVKANGDLLVLYQTSKNFANGEIWGVARHGGVWQAPALRVGGGNTGFSHPSCQQDDANDAGVCHYAYAVGAGSHALVENSAAI